MINQSSINSTFPISQSSYLDIMDIPVISDAYIPIAFTGTGWLNSSN